MKYEKYILIILALFGFLTFFSLKGQIIDGNCGGTVLECRLLGKYAVYLWLLKDFSLATLVVGILNLIKPVANRSLLVLTAISAIATIFAVISAPDISRSFLSPFDKKFVGQICSGAYLFIAVIIWLRAYLKNRK